MATKKNSADKLVLEAIVALKEKEGSSISAICKWVLAKKKQATSASVKAAVKRLVQKGSLKK